MPAKVAIVGAGFVGSTAAYALMLDGLVSEIALIDLNKAKAEGEALDLRHGMQFTKSTKIWAGDSFELVKGAAVVVLCAGANQKPGENRSDLLQKNVSIFKELVPKITEHNKDAILLVVTNPLDVLTYVTWKVSGLPKCRVFGTGTVLDTARLRYLLSRHFKVSAKDITAYMLGEHGDAEFPWWSGANIAGIPLQEFEECSPRVMEKIHKDVCNVVYEVIEKKGATYYAIALVIAKIVRSILLDQERVFTVSTVLEKYHGVDDIAMSVPTIIRREGVSKTLDVRLDENEKKYFHNSAEKIKKGIQDAAL
jgi:L-lactate dehydrogenase